MVTNEELLRQSTETARKAAAMIGGTYTQGVGYTPGTTTYKAPSTVYKAPTTISSPTTSLYSGGASYSGPSITDFLRASGQPSDFSSRQALASKYGITNYTGTASQNAQLLNILKGFSTGSVSPLGIPNTLSSPGSIPSPTSPIDASKLSTGYGDLSKILGANITPDMVSSDIAGLLSLYGASTDTSKQYDALTSELTGLMGKLGQEGADLQKEMEKQGVFAAYEQVKQLNLKAAQLQGELGKFDAESLQLQSNIENQAIPTGLIVGQQSQLQKQRDLTRISKAAELSATVALSQAYQGNAEIGLELASKAIDLKYMPILSQINVLKTQLGFASDKLSKEDANRAKIISSLLALKESEIEDQKSKELSIQELAIEAASNGAPLSIVNQIRTAPDLASAAAIGGAFVKGSLESIASSGSGGSTSGGGRRTSGGSTSGSTTLTATQLNKGSTGSGLSVSNFKALPQEIQNFFAFNASGVEAFNAAISGDQDAGEVIALIQSSNLAPEVKEYLIKRIKAEAPGGESTSDSRGGFLSKVGGFFSGAYQGVRNLLGI